jgi:hypothetical protein
MVRFARRLLRRRVVYAAAVALGAGVVAASLLGWTAAARSLLAALAVLVLLAVGWWVAGAQQANRALARDLRAVADLLQRRVVAAVEKDRLDRADAHRELLDLLAAQHTGGARLPSARADVEPVDGVPS